MDRRLLKAENVIFDIGRVLIEFKMEYVAKQMLPMRLFKYVKEPFFLDQWLQLDAGTTTSTESSKLICATYNLQGDEALFKNLMDNFCEVCSPLPLSSTITELQKAGKKVYLLTNYGEEAFKASKKYYPFLQAANGEVVSAVEKVCKPDEEIYKILLDRYNIDPSTAVYIDDKLENIKAARKLNIDSIWYPLEYNDFA